MFKKYAATALALLTAVLMLTACSSHEHTIGTTYKADRDSHWLACEDCDEKVDPVAHTMDEFDMCEVCGVTIYENGDASYSVISYDEQGAMSSDIGYDENGKVLYELTYENEYDENGNPTFAKEYEDGKLVGESAYLPCKNPENGSVYCSKDISYTEEGKCVSEYNEESMLLSYIVYDQDGNKTAEDLYEYTYDEAGHLKKQVCRSNGVVSTEADFAVDADGNSYMTHEVFYDENGAVTEEYHYDAQGNTIE